MGKDESVASERPRRGSPARLAMGGRMGGSLLKSFAPESEANAHLSADKKNNKKWVL